MWVVAPCNVISNIVWLWRAGIHTNYDRDEDTLVLCRLYSSKSRCVARLMADPGHIAGVVVSDTAAATMQLVRSRTTGLCEGTAYIVLMMTSALKTSCGRASLSRYRPRATPSWV